MIKKSFFDFFPVPEYLNFPAVGLDISPESVRLFELKLTKNSFEIGKYDKEPVSFLGEKPSDEDIIRAIIKLVRRNGVNFAHISLPEEQAYFLKLRLPKVNKKEIREAIELQLEEHIPYSPTEVTFDYEVFEDNFSGENVDVGVSVIPKAVIDRYIYILESSGVTPISFEIEAESVVRAVVPRDYKGTMMIANIGKKSSVLSIASRGVIWFSFTTKVGGDMFARTISEMMSVSVEEAERVKTTRGLNRSRENQELVFALAPAVSSLRDEIIKHYWYWNAHKGSSNRADIDKILICGLEASMRGLPEYLSASMGILVKQANPWANILSFEDTIPKMNLNESLEYVTAIGLALKEEERRRSLMFKNKNDKSSS